MDIVEDSMSYSNAIKYLYDAIHNLDPYLEKDAIAIYFILQAIKELQHNKNYND